MSSVVRRTRHSRRLATIGLATALLIGLGAFGFQQDAPQFGETANVPVDVRELLQSKQFEKALAALDQHLAKAPEEAEFLTYLKGRTEYFGEKYDDALETFASVEARWPEGEWGRRARFGSAAVFLKTGDFRSAERIYEQEVKFLLSVERKHEIASIYLEFADAYFRPNLSTKKPDYEKALSFYGKALDVGTTREQTVRVKFRIARCQQLLNRHDQAIADYKKLVKDYPSGQFDLEARYQLGKTQLTKGVGVEARRTWNDLLDIYPNGVENQQTDQGDVTARDRVAAAAYEIAHTYGVPRPSSVVDLELGTAAASRFVASYPDHKLAPQAEYEVAQSYLAHSRIDDAIETLKKLLAEPRYSKSKLIPDARFLLGSAYLQQKQFEDAMDAWKDYLSKHPAHQMWAKAQQSIVDAQYLSAAEARQEKEFVEARNQWSLFLAEHPLDRRAPQILLEFGQMNYQSEKLTEAIADWLKLVSKYPKTNEASRAQYMIGLVYEERLHDFDKALEAYRKLDWGPFAAHAKNRLSRLTRQELAIETERVFRTNQTPRVRLKTRNIESVTVKAYRIDLETYFRKMHLATGVEALDIALIDPDKSFEFKIPDYTEYRQDTNIVDLPLEETGVMIVTVANDPLPLEKAARLSHLALRPQEATTMVVRSDMDVLVKSSRNELFVFAQNLRTGKPFANVKLLVSDGSKVFAEAVTGAEGIFNSSKAGNPKDWELLKESNDIRVFAINERHVASNVVGLQGVEVAQGISPRGFIFTERPAYRPGQLVNVKGVIRWVKQDQYFFEPGQKFTVDIADSAGRQIRSEQVQLSDFGSFALRFILPAQSPQGQYRIHVHDPADPDKHNYQGTFQVQEFKLPPIQMTVKTDRKIYYRGDQVEGRIQLRYYYGAPVSERPVQYVLPDGTRRNATTDKTGEVEFSFETRDFREDQVLQIVAQYPEQNLSTGARVFLATRGFRAGIVTSRDLYISGETFDVKVNTTDAAGEKVGKRMTLAVVESTVVRGKTGERTIQEIPVSTVKASGEGRATVKVDKAGRYVLRVMGTDRFGNPVSAEKVVTVSGDEDTVRLRILADKHRFNAGEETTVRLHWRNDPALALVTYQGARVLGHRLVQLNKGSNDFEIKLDEPLAPNFDLVVNVMSDTGGRKNDPKDKHFIELPSFHEASSAFEIARPLNVVVATNETKLQPGAELQVDITTTDAQGNPVSAEVSLAMVEKSLLDMFAGTTGEISEFFQGAQRRSALKTSTSCVFRYTPRSRAIDDAVIAQYRADVAAAFEDGSVRVQPGQMGQQLEKFDAPARGRGRAVGGGGGFAGQRGVQSFSRLLGGERRSGQELESLAEGLSMQLAQTEGQQAVIAGLQADLAKLGNRTADFENYYLDRNSNGNMSGRALRRYVNQLNERSAGKPMSLGVLLSDRFVTHQLSSTSIPADYYGFANSNITVVNEFQVRETAYWNPQIMTNENGKATLNIVTPSRSTAWQLKAYAISKGTLTGEGKSAVTVQKNLFGELNIPIAYVEGDKTKIRAKVHNDLVTRGTLNVSLKTKIGAKELEESRQVEVTSKGIHELAFDRVMDSAGTAELQLTVSVENQDGDVIEDTIRESVPVHAYGMIVSATAGGAATGNMTAWISPPEEMAIQQPELQIMIGGSIEKSLMDVLFGGPRVIRQRGVGCFDRNLIGSGLERTTSDLLAALAIFDLIGMDAGTSPANNDVQERIRSSVAALLAAQNDDGSWSWSGIRGSSDKSSSARALWALADARRHGFTVPADAFNKALAYGESSFAATRPDDYATKAVLLHALTMSGKSDFGYANRLYRARARLSARGLSYLALTFLEMKRGEIGKELLGLVKDRIDWNHANTETMALYALGLVQAETGGQDAQDATRRLLERRVGSRWYPERATGPAVAALAKHHRGGNRTADKYNLVVYVNDEQVGEYEIDATSGTQIVSVPTDLLKRGQPVAGQLDPEARKQRINFELTGRGQFTFNAVYSGFVAADDLKSTSQDWSLERYYEPAPLELDGREIPRGFGVLTGSYSSWRNPVTQLPVGKKAEVRIRLHRRNSGNLNDDQLEYLVLTESVPVGATVLEKSISGPFERYELAPGRITFYLGNRRNLGEIRYDVYGYSSGEYRAAPTVLTNYYDPSQMVLARAKTLTVLSEGQVSNDQYRLTPQELFELGKRYLAKDQFLLASENLADLFQGFRLKPEIYKQTVLLLFQSSLELDQADEIIRYFEVIKERYPDLEIPFDQIVQVGSAYRDINEYERSYLVFRATAEGSFMRESQVAGFLESQGELERAVQVMDGLLREYPAEPYVAAATYALAQQVFGMAPQAATDAKLRERRITRPDLLRNGIQRLDNFMSLWPTDPAADQAAFSLSSGLVELEDWDSAIERSAIFASRYPKSKYLDSFWYIMGFGRFARGDYEEALQMCSRVAEHTYQDPSTNRLIESPNKWRAVYIMGQVHHSQGQAADAITQYQLVADRFPDAKEAIQYFVREDIRLPEITTVKPGEPVKVELKFRNVANCEVKVYRIDLMKFSLLQRNLTNITKINLSGIRPLDQQRIELGDGKDYRDRTHEVNLALERDGAYLVVCRGEDLHTSGLVLVTPLAMEVQEDVPSGRVRSIVKNVVDGNYAPNVNVKVIGSRNEGFQNGETDLRGIFVADEVRGRSTIIAYAGDGQYAFHRGENELGPAPNPQPQAAQSVAPNAGAKPQSSKSELLNDFLESNRAIQAEQNKNLRKLFDNRQKGVPAESAF